MRRPAGRCWLWFWLLTLPVLPATAAQLVGRTSYLTSADRTPPAAREGVTVLLLAGERRLATVTDHQGVFRFDDVAPGQYELEASHPDGYTAHLFLDVPAGESHLHLRLATPTGTALATALWTLMALLIAGAFGGGMFLWGHGRTPKQRSAARALLVCYLLWMAAFCLLRVLAPEMQPSLPDFMPGFSAVLAALLSGCLVLVMVELEPRWPAAAAAVVVGSALTLVSRAAAVAPDVQWLGIGVGLLLWTTAAGWLLARWLQRPSYLVLSAILIAIGDTWSVFYGFTGTAVSSASPVMRTVVDIGTLPWPVLGSDLVHGVIGMGDFLFLAWFLAAAQRFGYGTVRSFWTLMAAFTIGIVMAQALVLTGRVDQGLPALPFMSLMFLAANRGRFDMSPDDKRRITVLVTAAALLVAAQIGWHGWRHGPEPVIATPVSARTALEPPCKPADIERQAAALAAPRPGLTESLASTQVALPAAGAELLVVAPATGQPAPAVLLLDHASPAAAAALARRGYLAATVSGQVAELWQPGRAVTTGAEFAAVQNALVAAHCLAHHERSTGQVVIVGGTAALAAGVLEPATAGVVLTSAWPAHDGPADEVWRRAFDTRRYAERYNRPLLVSAGTNTPELDELIAAYEASRSADKRFDSQVNDPRPGPLFETPSFQRWLAAVVARQRLPEPPDVEAGQAEGDLHLQTVGGSATRMTGVTFFVSVGGSAWEARYWAAVPARRRRGGWSAQVAISAPAESLAVLARVTAAEGVVSWSRVRQYNVRDLRLVLRPAPWPSPLLATFEHDAEGWRAATDRLLLCDLRPGGRLTPQLPAGAGDVTFETNNLDVLRRLGAQAAGLSITLPGGQTSGALEVTLVEHDSRRTGHAAGKQFTASLAVAASGRRTVRAPWEQFRTAPPRRPIDWSAVDRLAIAVKTAATDPVSLGEVRLYGPHSGQIRAVEEQP